MRRKLLLMDMTHAGNMNGVTRCLQILVEAFAQGKEFEVIWVRFTHMQGKAVTDEEKGGYRLIRIPLPTDIHKFFGSPKTRNAVWMSAMRTLEPSLSENPILHVHTLNLTEFAVAVRRRFPCKVVTHLHCLPWKGTYNRSIRLFNELYQQYYQKKDYSRPAHFIQTEHERLAYVASDCLVCVTECARDFVRNVCPHAVENIRVVPNGIQDWALPKNYGESQRQVRCIFVGSAHSSKGLRFVLAAMQACLLRCQPSITVVGAYTKEQRDGLLGQYPFLDIHFTGEVGVSQLRRLYAESDIGLIGSIQEQCSYVAIEMMMAGLPVVTTDVDGLSEIFTENSDGIKIPVTFSSHYGLNVDIAQMADAVERLCLHPELRRRIGRKARETYLQRYTQTLMTDRMKEIYLSLD